jgi:hypothetical protein
MAAASGFLPGIEGLGGKVQGLVFRVQDLGLTVSGCGLTVKGIESGSLRQSHCHGRCQASFQV